jgi:hypothetical protein
MTPRIRRTIFVLVLLFGILVEPGEEVWVSYGTSYNSGFMELEPVRSFFCSRAQVNCSERYVWQP